MPAIIYDFDGVLADSEALTNSLLAEFVTALGCPTDLDRALRRYSGRRWIEAKAQIEGDIGRPLPDTFIEEFDAAMNARLPKDLKEVHGASTFLSRYAHLPHCIASSSVYSRLELCISILGLGDEFGRNVISGDMVANGKPHPDIFLLAADRLGVAPGDCLVIEDSASGVKAAVAAGMTALGLCAASHIREGHQDDLRAAGAAYLADTWAQATEYARAFSTQTIAR